MLESKYQAHVIKRLRRTFPGCLVMKNDTNYLQGIPDLTILYGTKWAVLEVKPSLDADVQPNQNYYVEWLNTMSFAAFIYPENEEAVFNDLQQSLHSRRATRISQREQVPLDQLRRRKA